MHSRPIRQALDRTSGPDRQRLAEEIATKAATPEAVAAFSEDLLVRYAPLMPANPRLVKRVANSFGMLLALGLHLNHHEDDDTIARAAIMFVRFPALVDELLSEPAPPPTNPAHADRDSRRHASPWLRPDVQQLLRHDRAEPADITRIARCFGREYPPSTAPPPPSNGQVTTTPTIVNIETLNAHSAGDRPPANP